MISGIGRACSHLIGGAAMLSLCWIGGTAAAANLSETAPALPLANTPTDAQTMLDAQIAELKVEMAKLVTSARARLDALSPQERLAAPPVIWRVPRALAEFRDCAGCPQMVVIPAGEFTMGSPLSERYRGRKLSTASPSRLPSRSANSKLLLTNGMRA
jgi:formylglycine-generating enzyme required for sulfatase activity